jgi:hypothetical protein
VASVGPAAPEAVGRRFTDLPRRLALTFKVFFRRLQLDEELASGLDPAGHPARAFRAAQLLRPKDRRRLATSLERLVDDVDWERQFRFSPAVPFQHDQVAEARSTLLSLAHTLRSSERIRARGAAMVLMLLEDPVSPLYGGTARGALHLQAQTALDYLVGQRQPNQESSAGTASLTAGGRNGCA